MDFCYALNALRQGLRVERSGWNGKGMYIFLQKGEEVKLVGMPPEKKPPVFQDFIMMCTVQGTFVPWLASQTDILAEDWIVCNQVLPGGLNG